MAVAWADRALILRHSGLSAPAYISGVASSRQPPLIQLSVCPAGYKWVLLKEGQEPAAPATGDRGEPGSGPGPGSDEPGYLAGAGIEGGLGRGPELDRLRDMMRHRDDQLASLQDQLRQLEGTRDRWGLLCVGSGSLLRGSMPQGRLHAMTLLVLHAAHDDKMRMSLSARLRYLMSIVACFMCCAEWR